VLAVSDDDAAVSWSALDPTGRLCRWRFFGGRSEPVSAGHDCRHKTQQNGWQWSCPSSPGLSPLDRRRDDSHPISWHSATQPQYQNAIHIMADNDNKFCSRAVSDIQHQTHSQLSWHPFSKFHGTIQYNTIQRFVKRCSTVSPGALTELCKRLSKQECL